MDYENILVERCGRVALVRINRPRALNALDGATMRELMDALEALDADDGIGCMVITGNERAFAVGADIKEMADATAVEMLLAGRIELWDRLRGIGKPVIAAVSGWCLGGGCELAMACDMIVASENATFGQPEIDLGIIPGAGGTQRLTRAVGKAIAMEMVLGARRLSAAEAYQFGLVSRVVAPEAYLDEALKLADGVASKAPVALRLAKEAVNKAYEMTLSEGVAFERRLFYMLFATEDQKEGMDAFINKREPKWQGR
jgi:enoyl-CoA hydratase